MLNKYLKLPFTAFSILTGLFLQKVDAYTSPYASAKAAYAINYCANEFGIFNDAESFNNINRYMKNNHSMEPWQVYNLTQRKGFWKETYALVVKMGGCKKIAMDLQDRINAQPRGFSGLKDSSNNDYLYKLD
tara:strand:- start:30 stop:425 length:396 start_codon:yes stop_codon:yes gene_type:complete